MGGKWLEVLKEAVPGVTQALALHHPNIAANVSFVRAAETAGRNLGVTIVPAGVTNTTEIEQAVIGFAGEPHGGLIAMPNPVTVSARFLIAELATRYRLPTIGAFRNMTAAGTLLSYGNDGHERILRGARAGDLPVQAPTKFELIINLKTAMALGLTVPPSLLLRADEVIE
jgi:putative ABC transport system substrate-binding protein